MTASLIVTPGLGVQAERPGVAGLPVGLGGALTPVVLPRRRTLCMRCVAVAVLGSALLLFWVMGRPDVSPEALRRLAEQTAGARLQAAGFPWARLAVEGVEGQLLGEAPDADSQLALQASAPVLLADLVGVPGVVGYLKDITSTSSCDVRLRAALTLPAVRFAPGSHHVEPLAEPLLTELARVFEGCQGWNVVIEASVDGSAREAGMRRLGQRRAQAVAAALMLDGLAVERIEYRVAAGSDPTRRVSLHLEHEPQRR